MSIDHKVNPPPLAQDSQSFTRETTGQSAEDPTYKDSDYEQPEYYKTTLISLRKRLWPP